MTTRTVPDDGVLVIVDGLHVRRYPPGCLPRSDDIRDRVAWSSAARPANAERTT